MADKKVSALSAVTSISSDDLFMVVNDPQGTPASNKVSVKSIFNSVPANTSITGRFSTTANNTLAGTTTTISSNTTVSGNLTSSAVATFSGTLHVTGDKKFVLDLLHEEHVLLVHVSGFSPQYGKGHVRLVYLPDEQILNESFDRIDRFLKHHRSNITSDS